MLLLLGCVLTADPAPVDFAHDVVPIVKARCAECHAGANRKGGLSFDTRESLLSTKGVVVPGKPAESELVKRIRHAADHEDRMPPKGDRLTAKQIETLGRWIAEGAKWEAGFSFGKPTYQAPLAIKSIALPAGDGHPLDRLLPESRTWAPSDDATFLRRSMLDLVGLAPAAEDIAAFAALRVPDKRTRLIDDLLNRNRDYAEHWISFWNDHLRNDYSGTGFIDGGRKPITGWLYQSLLANKPYDQFVRELIAPSLESEGFTRGIKWRGNVNASQVVELQFAQNVGQVFLGINLKCASCHDSFIDGWKLTDAYGLAAVIADRPLELHRCDKPLGQLATPSFPFRDLGGIDPNAPRQERLKRVAELLTTPANGRFARTIVNRVWQRLMGRGLIEPVDAMAGEPWNESVLEWLASDFVANGYDLKQLIRRIATSSAYAAPSVPPVADGERFVFRGPVRKRLGAEQFTDLVWRLTGTAPAKPHAAFKAVNRGSAPVRASLVDADLLMRSLGRPNREQVVTTRPDDLTTLQALDLTNGAILAERLSSGAKLLIAQYPDRSADDWTAWLAMSIVGRQPTSVESSIGRELLGGRPTESGLADLMWALIALPETWTVR